MNVTLILVRFETIALAFIEDVCYYFVLPFYPDMMYEILLRGHCLGMLLPININNVLGIFLCFFLFLIVLHENYIQFSQYLSDEPLFALIQRITSFRYKE